MGFEKIANSQDFYGLISFDADSYERREANGRMSAALIAMAVQQPITDVFFFCHGWKGDLPAAREQYNSWIGAFVKSPVRQTAGARMPGFNPLLIGLHWPSQPWGDEEIDGASFAAPDGPAPPTLADYLIRLGDRPEIADPLRILFDQRKFNAKPDTLPPAAKTAYEQLDSGLGLSTKSLEAGPDADREGFDPASAFDDTYAFGGVPGFDGLLGPLRQLSYWAMKKRARTIGEGGMHTFLKELMQATAASAPRIHLMGHSFGTIVVSSMIGGPNARAPLPRPVDSVVLVQGAVSLWCYAKEIPFDNHGSGYYHDIIVKRKISGPLVTTRSRFDGAVGKLYPLASRLHGAVDFAPFALPKYGGIGSFGIQGLPDTAVADLAMLPVSSEYDLQKGLVYNLESSVYIKTGTGISGAHNDVAGGEVAHAIWAAAIAAV